MNNSQSFHIQSKGEKVFGVANNFILIAFSIICLYPIIYVLACSLSYGPSVDAGKVLLIPKGFNLDSYKEILFGKQFGKQFWVSLLNSLFYTGFGSIFSMAVSLPAAYSLSKRRFKSKKYINLVLSFTMWFVPGFIPSYLNYTSLGATNNRLGVVVSFGIQAFYIILLRNYFEGIPESIEEAAVIDGANDFKIFAKIYLPLSVPSIVTVWLYYAISRWNSYFWTSVLLKDVNKIPLQVFLKQMIVDQALVSEYANNIVLGQNYTYNTLIYALIICSIIPMMILFPFVQKFFVKGVTAGGVKE